MAAPKPKLTPSQELMARIMRIVRTCPEAASEVLELMFLVSQIEAATGVDREYRDAKRVISRLRNPLWEMGPTDREKLLAAAETIRRVCRLAEDEIPPLRLPMPGSARGSKGGSPPPWPANSMPRRSPASPVSSRRRSRIKGPSGPSTPVRGVPTWSPPRNGASGRASGDRSRLGTGETLP